MKGSLCWESPSKGSVFPGQWMRPTADPGLTPDLQEVLRLPARQAALGETERP